MRRVKKVRIDLSISSIVNLLFIKGDDEYEYDEEEEGEQLDQEEGGEEQKHNDATTESANESTPSGDHKYDDGREIISVVTTKR